MSGVRLRDFDTTVDMSSHLQTASQTVMSVSSHAILKQKRLKGEWRSPMTAHKSTTNTSSHLWGAPTNN